MQINQSKLSIQYSNYVIDQSELSIPTNWSIRVKHSLFSDASVLMIWGRPKLFKIFNSSSCSDSRMIRTSRDRSRRTPLNSCLCSTWRAPAASSTSRRCWTGCLRTTSRWRRSETFLELWMVSISGSVSSSSTRRTSPRYECSMSLFLAKNWPI